MPQLVKLETTPAATANNGEAILYFAEESGEIVLKAKKSDGSIVSVIGPATPYDSSGSDSSGSDSSGSDSSGSDSSGSDSSGNDSSGSDSSGSDSSGSIPAVIYPDKYYVHAYYYISGNPTEEWIDFHETAIHVGSWYTGTCAFGRHISYEPDAPDVYYGYEIRYLAGPFDTYEDADAWRDAHPHQ